MRQIAEEREMYTKMYRKVISDSWIGVKEEQDSDNELPNLIDEDRDEESDSDDSVGEKTKRESSSDDVGTLGLDDNTDEDDLEFKSLVARYNEDRKLQKKELGSCNKKRCRRNRKIIEDTSQEGWMKYWKRMSKRKAKVEE